ncbi:MAG: SURF1 family protein [Jatrophihabitans sp.]
MFRTLRQPRYAMLGALMLIVAIACGAAGTWQIVRFEDKRHENDHLRTNADLTTADVAEVLPVVGQGPTPELKDVEFRTVSATGVYQGATQSLVRGRSIDGQIGFLVLTPLRTSGPTLLVVRGFIAQTSEQISTIPDVPSGAVTVTVRARSPETRSDLSAVLSNRQVQSINPTQQARRLGVDVFNGYGELEPGQPGSDGLTTLPRPDLSNPAGGALEPQHFAYVIQWYLFALLALAAPFAMARAEHKHRDDGDFDTAQPEPSPFHEPSADDVRAAKLSDRYGKPVR